MTHNTCASILLTVPVSDCFYKACQSICIINSWPSSCQRTGAFIVVAFLRNTSHCSRLMDRLRVQIELKLESKPRKVQLMVAPGPVCGNAALRDDEPY